MSETLSHLAAAALGVAPAIGPQAAAFFAPLARPPAAPLAEAVATLRAAPTAPAASPAGRPAPPPRVGDPARIDRPAPSLRRLVRAAAAGDLITPLSSWSPPPVEDESSRLSSDVAGDTASRPATEPYDRPRPAKSPADESPAEREPALAQPVPDQPRPPESAGATQREVLSASATPLASTISEPAPAGQAPELVQPATPARPAPLEVDSPFSATTPGQTAPAGAMRREALATSPGQAAAAGGPGPRLTGTAHSPAGASRPKSAVSEPLVGDTAGQAESSAPAQTKTGQMNQAPANQSRTNQARVNRDQQDPAGAPLKPAAPALEAGRPGPPADVPQSSVERRAVAAGPDSGDRQPAIPTPAVTLEPVQAVIEQDRPPANDGQAPIEQAITPAEPGQAPAWPGQALAEPGQALTEPGPGQLLWRRPQPAAALEPARAADVSVSPGRVRPDPDQPAPTEITSAGRHQPAVEMASGEGGRTASQPIEVPPTKPTPEPTSSVARQTSPPVTTPERPVRPSSPVGDKAERVEPAAIRPNVEPSIQPVLPPWPGTVDQPAAPAPSSLPPRPTIEITIGRVEVRLRPEAATPPQPAPRPKPALSLDDYLSRQGGRQ